MLHRVSGQGPRKGVSTENRIGEDYIFSFPPLTEMFHFSGYAAAPCAETLILI